MPTWSHPPRGPVRWFRTNRDRSYVSTTSVTETESARRAQTSCGSRTHSWKTTTKRRGPRGFERLASGDTYPTATQNRWTAFASHASWCAPVFVSPRQRTPQRRALNEPPHSRDAYACQPGVGPDEGV